MLQELMTLLRGTDPMREMYAQLIGMVEKSGKMFETIWGELESGSRKQSVREEIASLDVEVNKAERLTRKMIASHLVVRPATDIPACLMLMSVVKDAERLGDYCKDILDAAGLAALALSESKWHDDLHSLHVKILELFAQLRNALASLDTGIARDIMARERSIGERCEKLMERLACDEAPCREAIPWALTARYLKRVAAHISNIASGLVMPVHKIDYYDKDRLTQVN